MKIIKFKREWVNNSSTGYEGWEQTSAYDTGGSTVLAYIRAESKAKQWSGVNGIKEFCKEEFNAIIRHSTRETTNRWTSMRFAEDEQFANFLKRYIHETNKLL